MERTPKNCSPTVMSFPITVTFRSATGPAVPGGGGGTHTGPQMRSQARGCGAHERNNGPDCAVGREHCRLNREFFIWVEMQCFCFLEH